MKILHISTYDRRGGDGRAAYGLHTGLRRCGHDSRMFVSDKTTDDPSVVLFSPCMKPLTRLQRRIRRTRLSRKLAPYRHTMPEGTDGFCLHRSQHRQDFIRQLPAYDVANLHGVYDFLDYSTFFSTVSAQKPIIWTLHGMNPFTGGCHYDADCGRFQAACGACPLLGSENTADLSYREWRSKQAVFDALPEKSVTLVSPSRWLADTARRRSLGASWPVEIIPYGVDTDVFMPRDRYETRAELDIPVDACVIFFIAQYHQSVRKGYAQLMETLRLLPPIPNLWLLSAGNIAANLPIDLPHRHMDFINDDERLSCLYSAADVCVVPSLEDNLPNTVLESMACGTPVCGFETGGIPDMVRTNLTGLLARKGDVKGLSCAVETLLTDRELRARLSSQCRRTALDEYTLDLQARRYEDLYRRLLRISD